jgi:hypothetical protein
MGFFLARVQTVQPHLCSLLGLPGQDRSISGRREIVNGESEWLLLSRTGFAWLWETVARRS